MRQDLERLQQILAFQFRNPQLLKEALVHRSFIHEAPQAGLTSNERLEFLGDAVLGLVIAERLYRDYPLLEEGHLTRMRSSLVRTETLAKVGKRLNLGEYLLVGRGEEISGGRERPSNLARTFEAVAGAVLMDSGLAKAKPFVLRCLGPELQAAAGGMLVPDYKSKLQEVTQERWRQAPTYRLISSAGPDHAKAFQVVAEIDGKALGASNGSSKKQAEQQAAREALEALGAGE